MAIDTLIHDDGRNGPGTSFTGADLLDQRPHQMWGTDATASVTLAEGQVTDFAAIDHGSAKCAGATRQRSRPV